MVERQSGPVRNENGVPVASVKFQYPRNHLLLGTSSNLDTSGVHKALDVQYPLEISIDCLELPLHARRFALGDGADLRPFVVVYFRDARGGEWELIGRTETVVNDVCARFVTKLKMACATAADRLKEIRVVVYDRRSTNEELRGQVMLGLAECRLDDILGDKLFRKVLPLTRSSKRERQKTNVGGIALSAEVLRPLAEDPMVCIECEVTPTVKGFATMFFVLSRQMRSGDYTPIHRSELLGREGNFFKPVQRPLAALTAGMEDKLLRLEMYHYSPHGDHAAVGFMQTSIAKLRSTKENTQQLWWPCEVKSRRPVTKSRPAFPWSQSLHGVVDLGRVLLVGHEMRPGSWTFRFRFGQ